MMGRQAKIESAAKGRVGAPRLAERPRLQLVRKVEIDRARDALLTDFGRTTLEDRYLLAGESYQDMFARVATAFADDADHAQRVYDYMSKLWFMPATPVLSNGGASRGLPISCFLNAVGDSLESIVGTWNQNVWLAANGGGIGTYWGGVRSIGETVKGSGQTSGIIPFIRVMDSLTLAISQGSLRRGSAAVYVDIHHPEIEEFLEIRKPSGDFNRKSLNLHHGISITDEFMEAVRDGAPFGLRSPKTGEVVRDQLKAVGIDMKITQVDVSVWFDRFSKGNYQITSAYQERTIDPDNFYSLVIKSGGSINTTKYSNKKVDQLIDQAAATTDETARRTLYTQIRNIVRDEAPIIFAHYETLNYLMQKKVTGSTVTPVLELNLKQVGFTS